MGQSNKEGDGMETKNRCEYGMRRKGHNCGKYS